MRQNCFNVITVDHDKHNLPMGVVSKKEVGDLTTPDKAALKRLRLAIKLAKL